MIRVPLLALLVLVASSAPLAQTDTPLARSIARAAARAATTRTMPVKPAEQARPAPPDQTDWSRVVNLQDKEIVLSLRGGPHRTLYGSPSGRRTIVRGTASDTGLTVLDLTDPAIPAVARRALTDAASSHPEYFARDAQPLTVRLNRHVRLQNGAVLVDDRNAIDLERVIEGVDRKEVAEISRVHGASTPGVGWGVLVGTGIGAAMGSAACGSDCAGMFALGGTLWGAIIGGAIGAANKTATVVYRAP